MKKKTRRKMSILLVIGIAVYVMAWWGNNSIQVNEMTVQNEKLPKGFDGYKIVQVSDLHNKEFGKQQLKLLSEIEKQDPDSIMITGDLIDANHTNLQTAMELVEGMVKISPVYYVSGNYEKWSEAYDELKEELAQARVKVLENEKIELTNGNNTIELIGLKDVSFMGEEAINDAGRAVESALSSVTGSTQTFQLVLSHRPEVFETYVACGAG